MRGDPLLEIVTPDVDAICETYEATHDVRFGDPDPRLGNARTAALPDGDLVGVRSPLRSDEANGDPGTR